MKFERPMLDTNIESLKLDNPTMLAAGILGVTGSSLKRVAKAGAGAVVTKSISKNERSGYCNPTVLEDIEGFSLLNAMGLPNPGCEEFANEIPIAKEGKKPVIVSIFGSTVEEFVYIAKRMERAGADALELNLSCPQSTPGIQKNIYFGQDEQLTFKTTESVVNTVNIPVFVKLTTNVSSIGRMAKKAEEAGASAITAINTLPAARIDVNTGCPILANTVGGLSGYAIFPRALGAVIEIKSYVDIPVIGVGGVRDSRSAIEMLLAGASAVQIGTAIMYRDIQVFEEIKEGIKEYMKEHGYGRLEEFIGLSIKYF